MSTVLYKWGILCKHVVPLVCISRVGCVEPYRTSADVIRNVLSDNPYFCYLIHEITLIGI